MMPGVTQTAIGDAMTTLERGNVLRAASDAVVELMFRQSITQQWGRGTTVSSDGMSLDASRHLWNARVDPRRRTYGIGQYQHVLDRWGIVYNQPIVLGSRQAGALPSKVLCARKWSTLLNALLLILTGIRTLPCGIGPFTWI
jgi:TnpA family transposase